MASSAPAARRGLGALYKGWWHQAPDIVASGTMGLFGMVMGVGAIYYYYANNLDNRRYKIEYTVLRHDDPKAALIRKD